MVRFPQTTGFDAPKVTHVVMARPTASRVLYEQMVGRALRGPKFGGTESCVILDCEDNFRGVKPQLGYESFRHVWELETGNAGQQATIAGAHTEPRLREEPVSRSAGTELE